MMRTIEWLLSLLSLIIFFPHLSFADNRASDPREPTVVEKATFVKLLCPNPLVQKDGGYYCKTLIQHPGMDDAMDEEFSLTSITYGGFTKPEAHEAYLTYWGLESHADDFGGGILFEQSNTGWKLVRWYPGWKMENCLALPSQGKAQMLCLWGFMGQGELDSSLWVVTVPDSNDPDAVLPDNRKPILKAQDDRQGPYPEYTCKQKRESDQGILLAIDVPKHSDDPRYFAQVKITYATAEDTTRACKAKHIEKVKERNATVGLTWENGIMKADTPLPFMATDY